ncbi:MAG: hypothetical protein N3B18_06580 [Desulfobacterota bacterium]|nr:hypothetical protein [Thermodesulfobacteriota bacterium]
MEKNRYRPGMIFLVIVILALMQWFLVGSVQRELDGKLQEVHEAINTNSVINTALINILEKKNVLEKQQVLDEAARISKDIKTMLETMKQQKEYQESRQTSDNMTNTQQNAH